MGASLVALFALIYALVFVIGIFLLPGGMVGLIIMIGLTCLIVFFQYLISPVIIKWIYRIDWMTFEEYEARFPHLAEVVLKVCEVRNIKIPRMGIIHDLNPNAFTFGYTKNKARVVVTDGILKHCNKKEQAAVVAHEMGHVVHSDFILMTIVFAIPLVLLTIARWAFWTARLSSLRKSSDEGGAMYLALYVVAALSYATYYIGYLISLIVSRVREYYADEHAAEVTNDPNALSTALVKIAYGLVSSTGYTDERQRNKSRVRGARGLGIFNPNHAKGLAVSSVGGSGKFSKDAIQAAAAWDLFNPWAKYYQIFSTHPLPAKRIIRLNDQCELYGKKPEIDFSNARKIKEAQAGKSMIPEFITDLTIKVLPGLIFILIAAITVIMFLGSMQIIPIPTEITGPVIDNLFLLWAFGFFLIGIGFILRTMFMYKSGFEHKTVLDLVTQIKVSPVRCIPAVLEGKIIGRGIPGYYFSEDLYFQDETGLMHIDYESLIPFFDNLIFSIFGAKKYVGQRVRITGWYRRAPSPYVQINRIEAASGKRNRNFMKQSNYCLAALMFIIGFALFYFWFQISAGTI